MLKSILNKIHNRTLQKSKNNLANLPLIFSEQQAYSSQNSYHDNIIVYRCINLIAESASHVPWIVLRKRQTHCEKLFSHPAYKLLTQPNPSQAGASFFAAVIISKLLHGNAYILGCNNNGGYFNELHLLDTVSIEIEHRNGYPTCYIYQPGSRKAQRFAVDSKTMQSHVLHIKRHNPYDPLKGLSPLKAATQSIALHNQAIEWNNSLLQNGARPSGALIMRDHNQHLSIEQFERLRSQLQDKYSSASNSGKPLLLEGGLEWQEMSVSPKEMDFIEAKNSAARDIALAFGVPPQLLGINGDNTYSNMQEARLALWEDTIIPLLDNLSDSLTNWLSYWYQEELVISFDRDAISALTTKRENLWSKISAASFMTINEKRALVDLPPLASGDILNHGIGDD